jgi:hypothetical protein
MRPLRSINPVGVLAARLCAAGAVLLLLATGVSAQDEDPAAQVRRPAPKKPPRVGMQVQTGRANAARTDRATPIRVALQNNGAALLGRLVVSDRLGHSTETPVELPRGANKLYTLFARLSPVDFSPESGTVTLFEGRKGIAKQALLPEFPKNVLIVLCATGDGSNLQFLHDRTRRWVDSVSPQDLPRQRPGFDPANVVVLNGQAWAQMDDEQKRAFRVWVEYGGHAILCGETSSEWRDPEAQALVGVTPNQPQSLRALHSVAAWSGMPFRAEAGSVLTVSGPLAPGAETLFSEAGRPLIVQRETHLGQVLWIGFDPFRESLRNWPGMDSFWRRALETARSPLQFDIGHELSGVPDALNAARSLPRLPAPPLAAIIVFGLSYAVIFGPVNIAVLRRLRRTVRAWLFVPALALGMTLIVLFVGQSWGNARTVLNSLSVLRAANGGRTAMEDTVTGLFSPTNRAFDLAVDDPDPYFTDLGGAAEGESASPVDLGWPNHQVDGTVTWDQVALQLFAIRVLEHRRPRDLGGSFKLDLRPDGSGTVTNGTTLKVHGAYLARGGRYCWLGDLKAGATVPVSAGKWQKKLEQKLPGAPAAGEMHENEKFRESVGSVWRGADSLLVEPRERKETWLIAEVEDFTGGLQVAEVPFNNRAALVVVRGRDTPLAQSATR